MLDRRDGRQIREGREMQLARVEGQLDELGQGGQDSPQPETIYRSDFDSSGLNDRQ